MSLATRPAAVAGLFYPADARTLAREVDRLLGAVPRGDAARPPKLIVVPHAGYVYSGKVAAHAYALLAPWRDRIRRVVLLGPTHRVAVRGLAAPTVAAFATPLGRVDLDTAALAGLAGLPQVRASNAAHAQEHALEVQLPFLQRALGSFALVPLAVGDASAGDVAEVLEQLWGGDETLIVISTDLSHYLPYAEARAKDSATVGRILRLDPALDHGQACGATPLAGALLAARAHGLAPRLLDLRNSGDTAGDRSRVVGYAALAFEPGRAAGARDDEARHSAHDTDLGAALIGRARNAIARALDLPGEAAEPPHAALAAPGATFVTLLLGGELRGCVGTLTAERPLEDDVQLHALAAAFRDARFEPLAVEEFAELEVEVSLLDAAQPLPAANEADAHSALRPGVDGVILEWRGRRATFLPQVWEQLPQPREFLAALKHKAGLPRDFWAEDLRLSRYRVRKFVEENGMNGANASANYPARWWHRLDDGRLQCDLCPRDCRLHEGQRGLCFVRAREGDAMVLTTFGRSSGFCIDPIEKKPLNHFHPGSSVFSFGTAGCNLACKFCQNWDISKSREMDRLMDEASPESIAAVAQETGCRSVAFTYNDPVIFAEYALATADACHAAGVQTVAVTAGYIHAEPRVEFYAKMDAANVDLKGFTEAFYFQQTGAHLAPVLETLEYIARETSCWLEITTLLIPGLNDSAAEIDAMTQWIAARLGPEVPLHFTAFHPDYKMTDRPATPPATLRQSREIALANGLRYVYTGNVHDPEGGTTACPGCERPLIVRDWHEILHYRIDKVGEEDGACPHCGHRIAGRFGHFAPPLGRRRIPVRVAP